MALIHEPKIFKRFPGVRAAMTLRGTAEPPFGFNMSLTVGDMEERVHDNRARLARRLGFEPDRLASQRQVHGETIARVDEGYAPGESDALVTDRPGWLLAISIADCVPVLFADTAAGVVGAAHAGWKGAIAGVTDATLGAMESLGADRAHIVAAIGPCIGRASYEVDEAFVQRFVADGWIPTREGAAPIKLEREVRQPGVPGTGAAITLEPGGQFELSGSPYATVAEVVAEAEAFVRQTDAYLADTRRRMKVRFPSSRTSVRSGRWKTLNFTVRPVTRTMPSFSGTRMSGFASVRNTS